MTATTFKICLATMSTLFALAPSIAVAAPDTGRPVSFRTLEFEYPADQRVGAMEQSLQSRIPAGTGLEAARATIRQAGAHCPTKVQSNVVRCRFGSFESVESALHDVVWDVTLHLNGNAVTRVDVSRQTFGS